jgi:hypothetical protein
MRLCGATRSATHQLRPADQDLAGGPGAEVLTARRVDHARLGAGQEDADLLREVALRLDSGRDRDPRRALGHPIALFHEASEPLGALLLELDAERGGAAPHEAQARQVVVVHGRVAGERQRDRRDDDGEGHPVVLDRPQERLEVEARHRHDGGSGRERGVHQDHEPERVEEGGRRQHDVVLAHVEHGIGLDDVGDERAVTQLDALGQPGGAARIEERRGPVRIDRRRWRFVPVPEEQGERRGPLALAEHEQVLASRLGGRRARLLEEGRHGEERAGVRVGELVCQLVRLVERIGGRDHAPERHRGVHRHGVLRDVRRVDRKHVPLREPACREPGGGPANHRRELLVGNRPAARRVDQRGPAGSPLRSLQHVARQIALGQRGTGPGAREDGLLYLRGHWDSSRRVHPVDARGGRSIPRRPDRAPPRHPSHGSG